MKTAADIVYRAAPYPGPITTIPRGTPVRPADNLPPADPALYWVEPWQGMTDGAVQWFRQHGFLVDATEVTE